MLEAYVTGSCCGREKISETEEYLYDILLRCQMQMVMDSTCT